MDNKSQKNVNFDRKLQELENKQRKFTASRVTSANDVKKKKEKILTEFFSKMKASGVDFSDQASINEFLQQIEAQDPDFLVLLENAIGHLSEEKKVEELDRIALPGSDNSDGMINREATRRQL